MAKKNFRMKNFDDDYYQDYREKDRHGLRKKKNKKINHQIVKSEEWLDFNEGLNEKEEQQQIGR